MLGKDARLALASKVSVLDKITKASSFAENVVNVTTNIIELGSAISEVSNDLLPQKDGNAYMSIVD